jgi:hypothetical protein
MTEGLSYATVQMSSLEQTQTMADAQSSNLWCSLCPTDQDSFLPISGLTAGGTRRGERTCGDGQEWL